MRMAARIQRVRLERSVTLEDVEAKTGLAKSLVTRLEKGREVPSLSMLDTLAGALDVPVHVFFYDAPEPKLTPRLTPRPALKELAEEADGPATSAPLWNPRRPVLAAVKAWSGLAVPAFTRRRLLVKLRPHRANHQRGAQGGTQPGRLRRLKIEMKLLLASLFSWFNWWL